MRRTGPGGPGSRGPGSRDLRPSGPWQPVRLLSSGPIGEPRFPPDEPYDIATLATLSAPRGHRVFPGRLDTGRLTFRERAMVTAMRAPVGDFRDWDAVRAWAAEIAGALAVPCLLGVPVGHIDDQWTLPLGAAAELDADEGALVVL